MRQCRGDLYSVELEERAVSSARLVTWLIEDFSTGTALLMNDPEHSALTVLTP